MQLLSTVTICFWYWFQMDVCHGSLFHILCVRQRDTGFDLLLTNDCCGCCTELRPQNWKSGLALGSAYGAMQFSGSAAHSYFTMWNKFACNESPRTVWCLHNRACFLPLLWGRSIEGLLIFQHAHLPNMKTWFLCLMGAISSFIRICLFFPNPYISPG